MRIVSLIASATEILCELGLRSQMVGRSHECDYPADVAALPVLSSPKVNPALPGHAIDSEVRAIVANAMSVYRVDVEGLDRLQPDLIVTQDHCEICAVSLQDVEAALCQLTNRNASICTLHPDRLSDVYEDVLRVARAAGAHGRGQELVSHMRLRLADVSERSAHIERPRVALIEWLEPPMIAGGWMPELATMAGAQPVIVEGPETFATVDWAAIAEARPDRIVVMPCGYDLRRTREELGREEVAAPLRSVINATGARCHLADGNAYFNRPGPRLADTGELLAGLLHPDRFPEFAERYRPAVQPWPSDAEP